MDLSNLHQGCDYPFPFPDGHPVSMNSGAFQLQPVPTRLVLVTGVPGTGKSAVAEAAADIVGAAVLAHDWAMSALRPYAELQAALDAMEPPGNRRVGWSILASLAQAQLQRGFLGRS
jgi:hypothetical protein